ncbi:hypothetical protein MAM1_0102d05285 [Mucor ambiguus]|uniref:Uncharacterized protein n=1 Tax=Mucor ambiguus TaxID=91626 RepID=A0A0C9LUY0_9FUNG|nr:hypothetical protein MAM1_0102d05285 [Mucor ambiguus]
MSQTQITISNINSLEEERREVQQMDEEIQIMKEKQAKMKVLNELELELATLALLRQQYRFVRLKTENKMKELYREDRKLLQNKSEDVDDSDDSLDSNLDIK